MLISLTAVEEVGNGMGVKILSNGQSGLSERSTAAVVRVNKTINLYTFDKRNDRV